MRRGGILQHPDAEVVVLDAEILAAAIVEGLAEVVHEVRMQLARGMQADLGDQTRKINEAADGFVGAEESRDDGHGREDR